MLPALDSTVSVCETTFTSVSSVELEPRQTGQLSKKQLENEERLKYENQLYYRVDEVPPWPTALLFGFQASLTEVEETRIVNLTRLASLQQVMVCTSGVVATPLIIADLICAKFSLLAKVKLIGTQVI